MNGKHIERRGVEPGPVNLWGLILGAIESTPKTVRLLVILAFFAAAGKFLGLHFWL